MTNNPMQIKEKIHPNKKSNISRLISINIFILIPMLQIGNSFGQEANKNQKIYCTERIEREKDTKNNPPPTSSPGHISILSFPSIDPSGASDSTVGMQLAHDTGAIIYYPRGIYKFSTITMKAGGIVGESAAVSSKDNGCGTIFITTASDSKSAISFTGSGIDSNPPIFQNFMLHPSEEKKVGIGIDFRPENPSKDRIHNAFISNIHLRNIPIPLNLNDADSFTVRDSFFFFYSKYAIKVANELRPDVGDSQITGNHFFNGKGTSFSEKGVSIYQESSGGLRIYGNKFNGGYSAYQLSLLDSTSDTIFVANSFENTSGPAIIFGNKSNTKTNPTRFQNIVVVGNQFSANHGDILFEEISNFKSMSYWDNITITGNTFYVSVPDHYSITLKSSRSFNISANVFNSNNIGTGAISVDHSSIGGDIGLNSYVKFKTNPLNIPEETNTRIAKNSIDGKIYFKDLEDVKSNKEKPYERVGVVKFSTEFQDPPTVFTQATGVQNDLSITITNVTRQYFEYKAYASKGINSNGFFWRADGIFKYSY